MSETTQYRYWLERLRQMGERATPAAEAENTAKRAGHGTDKTDKTDAEASEIAWRVTVMRPQVPAKGPIPFLVAREASRSLGEPPWCLSCGDALAPGRTVRCVPCVLAIETALNEVREGA